MSDPTDHESVRAAPASAERPVPGFRDPERAAEQRRLAVQRASEREAESDRAEPGPRMRAAVWHAVYSPLTALLAFLLALTFAVNRARIGSAVSGGALLPAPNGGGTLLADYQQEWHSVGGGTSAPAPALSGLLGLLGAPFGGADHAIAVLLLAAMPLAGLSAYCATRATGLHRGQRALLGGIWALLPAGAVASSFGRIDTLFTYILLPLVLAGLSSVLRGAPAGVDRRGRAVARSRWLSTTAATALALAVLTSAAPVMYLLIVMVALVGFVLLRPAPGTGLRRATSLFFVVLLPVGLLLPWPAELLTHPGVFLHGVGSTGGVPDFSPIQLLTLGRGVPSIVGVLVVLAALALLITVPTWRMVAGAALVVLGAASAAVLGNVHRPRLVDRELAVGNPGPALLLMSAGLLLVIAVGLQQRARRVAVGRRSPLMAALGVAIVAVLAVGAVLGGSVGDVRARPTPSLPAAFQYELLMNQALVLTTAAGEQPARLSSPALPQLGDDDLALTAEAASRITAWSDAITAGTQDAVAAAVAQAAASGVGAVVLPAGTRLSSGVTAALLADAGQTTDGRTVFRVQLPARGARVLEPGLATASRTGGQPPGATGSTTTAAQGTSPVPGGPPELRVRVSNGSDGRLLVLAAENENGWEVHVDGTAVEVAPAYGHLVGVALPGTATEVTVQRSSTVRSILLLVQAGVLLFTLLLAIPPRGRVREFSPAQQRPGRSRPRRRGRWSLRRRRGK